MNFKLIYQKHYGIKDLKTFFKRVLGELMLNFFYINTTSRGYTYYYVLKVTSEILVYVKN